jgi:Cof subfamily protein (haloacid dehalogenase superfamily)
MDDIRLIALDLDGTLLAPDESISPGNRRAIAHALAGGIRVVLVTGRGVDIAERISAELGLSLPVICCHGALTKDVGRNKVLVHIPVPLEYARPMLAFAQERALAAAVYVKEAFWRLRGSHVFLPDMVSPAWHETASFADVLTTAPTFLRFLGEESARAVSAEFGDLPLDFRHERWGDFVECAVLSRNASKQNALARLCADFQVPAQNVLAIGDSPNDIPMLQWAGVGVAMANALPTVLEATRYHTTSNERDGVALAIERFALKEKKTA